MRSTLIVALACAGSVPLASAEIVPFFQDRMVEVVGSISLPGGGSMVDDDQASIVGFGEFQRELLCGVASSAASATCRATHYSSISPLEITMSGVADSGASAIADSGETSSGNSITGMMLQFDLLEPTMLRFVGEIEEIGSAAAFTYLKHGNDVIVDLPTGSPASVDVTLNLLPGRYEFMTCTGSSAFVGNEGGAVTAFASVNATISIVPEPATIALLALSAFFMRRR